MLKRGFFIACAGLVLLAGTVTLEAWGGGVDCFLRLDGIQGESVDPKHKDEIEVLSWALTDPLGMTGVPYSGHRRLELTVTKNLDKASPRLFQAYATGEHMREGRLSFIRTAASSPAEFLRYRLLELRVTSYSIGGTDSMPLETVVLSFAKSEMEYRPQNRDGSLGHPVTSRFE